MTDRKKKSLLRLEEIGLAKGEIQLPKIELNSSRWYCRMPHQKKTGIGERIIRSKM